MNLEKNIKKNKLKCLKTLIIYIGIMLFACFSITNFILNLQQINKVNERKYDYHLPNQNMVTYCLSNGKQINIYFSDEAAKIIDSYELSRDERIETVCFIKYYFKEKGIVCTRTVQNLEAEWAMHNFLYRINYQIESTKDADLDYIQDKRWYVNAATIVMQILGV